MNNSYYVSSLYRKNFHNFFFRRLNVDIPVFFLSDTVIIGGDYLFIIEGIIYLFIIIKVIILMKFIS